MQNFILERRKDQNSKLKKSPPGIGISSFQHLLFSWMKNKWRDKDIRLKRGRISYLQMSLKTLIKTVGKWKHIAFFLPEMLFWGSEWNFALLRFSLGKIFNQQIKFRSEIHLVLEWSFFRYGQPFGSSDQNDLLHQFTDLHPSIYPTVSSAV